MTRVSLKEAYDNKDVVAQIYAIRDIAEGAEDTANNAVSTANTASEHVDALVPQVEGAVQNANNASASAQASAQTVAGYENRLSDVELRVTTAEGNIVTIQGRVTALETADGQNVKINNINDYAIGLTGNQDNILGNKNFKGLITLSMSRIGFTGSSGYNIVYRFKNTTRVQTLLITGGRTIIMAQVSAAGGYKGQLFTSGRDYKTPSWMWVVTDAATGDHYLVTQGLYSATMNIHVINSFQYGTVYPYQDDIEAVNQSTSNPTTDSRWSSVVEVVNYD